MLANFLPASAHKIQEVEAVSLLEKMERPFLPTPFQQGQMEIATATAHAFCENSSNTAPIVLLHGFDSSLLEFRRVFPLLASHHHTWALDLFGFGFTEYTARLAVNPPTIRVHLLQCLKNWVTQPVVLVGASLGGAVAIDFALHYPNWVRALVLIDSVGFSGHFPVGEYLPDSVVELGAGESRLPCNRANSQILSCRTTQLNSVKMLTQFNAGRPN